MVPSLVFYGEWLLRYEYFVCTPYSFKSHKGCHENHEVSYNQNSFIFRPIFVMHLSGPIEQIFTLN